MRNNIAIVGIATKVVRVVNEDGLNRQIATAARRDRTGAYRAQRSVSAGADSVSGK
jgi:hypothetical protein